jgi:dienelactone hydrolase
MPAGTPASTFTLVFSASSQALITTLAGMPFQRRLLALTLALTALAACATAGYAALAANVRHRELTLPAPSGPYPVGRATYRWVDTARIDPLAPSSGQPRRLAAWVWYPAADTAGRARAPYLLGAWRSARSGPFWRYLVQDPRRIFDHAVPDAPPVRRSSRVLVMEPGLGLAAVDYATVAEDLASHGYVVLGVTPTYSTNNTVLDGRLVPATAAGKRAGDDLAAVWAADARFALDRLGHEPRFAAALDPARAGFFGHSFGGASAAEACSLDDRCVGAADVDGQPFGTVVKRGLNHPYLLVCSQPTGNAPDCADDPAMRTVLVAARPTATAYTIRGARHFNFTDLALYHFTRPCGASSRSARSAR